MALSDQFPVGLRVLVVDDDTTCLKILEQMLRRCLYSVTLCSKATVALNLLRERRGCFDVVLSDVHMPDMDGYKLLEHVGLEMDLPVIMISGDGRTSTVMRGIKQGACDYLIKPIRLEELKNIWQHVVRKRWNECKEREHSDSLKDTDRHRQGYDDCDYASSVNDGAEGTLKAHKKKIGPMEDDNGELENDDSSTSKKPRLVWSVELHQQFVSAVNQLGLDKAVPKRILEVMNVPGLTRENVASHLQKFRLYLKRLSCVAQQQVGVPHLFCGPLEQNMKFASLGTFDVQSPTSGQIPSQALAALHAELFKQSTGNLSSSLMDQPALVPSSLQRFTCFPIEQGAPFVEPLVKCQFYTSKPFSQSSMYSGDALSFGVWPTNSLGTAVSSGSLEGVGTQNTDLFVDVSRQQQLQQQPLLPETSQSSIVQPSCLLACSQPSRNFQGDGGVGFVNHDSSFSQSSFIDYSMAARSNNSSVAVRQNYDLSACSPHGSASQSMSPCSINTGGGTSQQDQSTTMASAATTQLLRLAPDVSNVLSSCTTKSSQLLDHGSLANIGFAGKGSFFP
ncbi:hypothetical protein Nepgr_028114 [Nepenthes gracilis]|uniref:Two-component response regulator n=1 Tax=Nepenthes gracilis TaxID=150966 RepID=A0AAD3TCJ0_NEPGR|nr:hypothetical protein Nepgr_028114 [Nepenthes gracilis]